MYVCMYVCVCVCVCVCGVQLHSENLKVRDHLEILVVEEIIILKVTVRK
jgi:hypothetical protein